MSHWSYLALPRASALSCISNLRPLIRIFIYHLIIFHCLSTHRSTIFWKNNYNKTLTCSYLLAFCPVSNLLYSISPNSALSRLLTLVLFDNADNHLFLKILLSLGTGPGQRSTEDTCLSFPNEEPSCCPLPFQAPLDPRFWQCSNSLLTMLVAKGVSQISLMLESFSSSASLWRKCKWKTIGPRDCYHK